VALLCSCSTEAIFQKAGIELKLDATQQITTSWQTLQVKILKLEHNICNYGKKVKGRSLNRALSHLWFEY